jgi:hypothetical protein
LPYRFGIRVLTDTYPNPFGAAYSGPPSPYDSMGSDYLEVLSKATDSQGIYPTAPCTGTSGPFRSGNELCLAGTPSDDSASWDAGRYLLVTDSTMGMGCLVTITAKPAVGVRRVPFSMGVNGADPVIVSDPCRTGGSIWSSTNATVTLARAAGFRVNWANGGVPVLQMSQDVLASTPAWVDISRQVERVKVTLGLQPNLAVPTTTATTWFGYAATGVGPPHSATPIDMCAGSCAIPGVSGPQDALFQDPYERLMRRVRTVDVSIRVRSPTADKDKVQKTGSTYTLDEDELPMDGFVRRTSVFHASPRNLSIAGNFAP